MADEERRTKTYTDRDCRLVPPPPWLQSQLPEAVSYDSTTRENTPPAVPLVTDLCLIIITDSSSRTPQQDLQLDLLPQRLDFPTTPGRPNNAWTSPTTPGLLPQRLDSSTRPAAGALLSASPAPGLLQRLDYSHIAWTSLQRLNFSHNAWAYPPRLDFSHKLQQPRTKPRPSRLRPSATQPTGLYFSLSFSPISSPIFSPLFLFTPFPSFYNLIHVSPMLLSLI